MAKSVSPYAGQRAASFGFKDIMYEKTGFVARITINRPSRSNSLNLRTLMSAAVKDAAWDDAVAVLVLETGAGDRAFSTGADLQEQKGCFLGNRRIIGNGWGGIYRVARRIARNRQAHDRPVELAWWSAEGTN